MSGRGGGEVASTSSAKEFGMQFEAGIAAGALSWSRELKLRGEGGWREAGLGAGDWGLGAWGLGWACQRPRLVQEEQAQEIADDAEEEAEAEDEEQLKRRRRSFGGFFCWLNYEIGSLHSGYVCVFWFFFSFLFFFLFFCWPRIPANVS